MRIVAFLLALLLIPVAAEAQFTFPPVAPPAVSGFTGPGDVVSGWAFWGGLRAFSGATTGTKAANICNSGDANCADVNTLANGNFDVTTAQASPLNCGGVGGTCTVKTLYDKSGNGRDLTQATAANRPVLTFSCVGALPCVTFATANPIELVSAATLTLATPLTLSAVVNVTDASNSPPIIGGPNYVSDLNANATPNGGLCDTATSCIVAAMSLSAWHSMIGVSNGASSSIVIDGTSTTGTITTNGLSGQAFHIAQASRPLGGMMAEGGQAGSALSGPQVTALCHNERLYWTTGGTC